jgi:uncharacterized protein (UPF0335 family)
LSSNTQQVLRDTIERLEKIEEEKGELTEMQKRLLIDAKLAGFDTKAIRRVLQLRKMDPQKREEHRSLVDLYMDTVSGEKLV